MVEHPDSEPSTTEAVASFHPHKATSPKHTAGVLGEVGMKEMAALGLSWTWPTSPKESGGMRRDQTVQGPSPSVLHSGTRARFHTPGSSHLYATHHTPNQLHAHAHPTHISHLSIHIPHIHTTCAHMHTHAHIHTLTALYTTHNTLRSTHHPQACPPSGLSSKYCLPWPSQP